MSVSAWTVFVVSSCEIVGVVGLVVPLVISEFREARARRRWWRNYARQVQAKPGDVWRYR